MHFLLEGRVGIVVTMDDGRSLRVRSLGRHTTIGEMGLIASRNRSATIQAEMPSVLYELSADAYAKIMKLHPDLGQALLSCVVAIMSDRLAFANRAVGVLQR
jgi:SulP family sulfate permease